MSPPISEEEEEVEREDLTDFTSSPVGPALSSTLELLSCLGADDAWIAPRGGEKHRVDERLRSKVTQARTFIVVKEDLLVGVHKSLFVFEFYRQTKSSTGQRFEGFWAQIMLFTINE